MGLLLVWTERRRLEPQNYQRVSVRGEQVSRERTRGFRRGIRILVVEDTGRGFHTRALVSQLNYVSRCGSRLILQVFTFSQLLFHRFVGAQSVLGQHTRHRTCSRDYLWGREMGRFLTEQL